MSIANLISVALFGDGGAALLMVGKDHPQAEKAGPSIVATESAFFADTEHAMGWAIGDDGFHVVLGSEVPRIAEKLVRPRLESFLAKHSLSIKDIATWIAHPGGPKIMTAFEKSFELDPNALQHSQQSIREIGNISSASVLDVYCRTVNDLAPAAGSYGVMLALGPGFCAEFVLMQW
ncbi:MAG: hypothetical protein IPJ88_05490 [Myxococcales bacterium]|nr:MAG: hypothetical protein IPJ88_05490 [Myxococcales bacterium]